MRELRGGVLVQPREASSWKRGVLVLQSPRSKRNQTNGAVTLKDGALNQQRSLETSVHAPPTRKAKDVRSSEPVYDITNVLSSRVVVFEPSACLPTQTSPEDGSVFIGNNI